MKAQKSTVILGLFLIAMLINLFLSGYIEYQKNLAVQSLVEEALSGVLSTEVDVCFRTVNGRQGSCATVQNGPYSILFGIEVGLIGVIFFTMMSVLFALLFFFKVKNHPFLQTRRKLIKIIFFLLLVGGSLGATRFIYLQLYVIKAVCTYCMWIDGILIVSTVLFLTMWKKLI
jgi:uncharacterized membrane protein